jgi:hypothetical protein
VAVVSLAWWRYSGSTLSIVKEYRRLHEVREVVRGALVTVHGHGGDPPLLAVPLDLDHSNEDRRMGCVRSPVPALTDTGKMDDGRMLLF